MIEKTKYFKRIAMLGLLALVTLSGLVNAQEPQDFSGDWEAVLNIDVTNKLPLVIHLENSNGVWSGTLDTPSQGGFGIPMSLVKFNKGHLLFEIKSLSIHYEGNWDTQKKQFEGTFIQGSVFPLDFYRAESKAIVKSNSNENNDVIDTWQGIIEIPNTPLTFVVKIEEKDGKLHASALSPDQHSKVISVDSIQLENGRVTLAINRLDAKFEGDLSQDGKEILGKFSQKGYVFNLTLNRGEQSRK